MYTYVLKIELHSQPSLAPFQVGDDDEKAKEGEEGGAEVDPSEGGRRQLVPRGPHQRADVREAAQPPHQGHAGPLGREDLKHSHLSGNVTSRVHCDKMYSDVQIRLRERGFVHAIFDQVYLDGRVYRKAP